MYIILIIILFIISYFVLNIYEKFQTVEEIENICDYPHLDTLRYKIYEGVDDKKIKVLVNDYLKHCKNPQNLEISFRDLMKLLYNTSSRNFSF